MTPMKADDSSTQPYAMQVLMEEVATLRKRVREFEDDQEASTDRSGKTVDSDIDSNDQLEVLNLRKELKKVEDEKAALELDFMNQISEIARDSSEKVDAIQKAVDKTKEELKAAKQSSPEADAGAGGPQKEAELLQLKEDLASADKELEVNRKDVDELYKKVNKLESQKVTLSDEVSGLRVEVDGERKVIISLSMAMEENEKHFNLRIEKHESEMAQQRSLRNKEKENQTMTNGKVSKLESQKGMLLEEITDIRMQLDREEQSKNSFKKKFEDLEQNGNSVGDSAAMGSLKQAVRDAEDKTEELQSELRAVAKSYKNDVSRLEENISSKESEIEKIKRENDEKDENLSKLQEEKITIGQQSRELREKLEKEKGTNGELEHEVSNLKSKYSAYERKTSESIMENVAKTNELKGKMVTIEDENIQLKCDLSIAKKATALKIENKTQNEGENQSQALSEGSMVEEPWPSTDGVQGQDDEFESICIKIRKLKDQVKDLEEQLSDANKGNETLLQRLKIRSEQAGELQAEVATLSATRQGIEESLRSEYDEKIRQLKSTVLNLETEKVLARKAIHSESEEVNRLKNEIREMTTERLAYEECTMQAIEKRVTASKKRYQGDMNSLKVELTNLQMKYANTEREHKKQIEGVEQEMENLNIECDTELEEKHGELEMVRHKLDEQMDMVRKLEKERAQLCLQMNSMSGTRRDELEEIQADLMEMTAKNTSLNRALQALQMQVEHQADNSNELLSLRAQFEKLQGRNPVGTSIHKQQTQLETLIDENKELQEKVRTITYERRSLQEQLRTALDGSTKRSMQVLRERNEKLRKDVARLTRKLQNNQGSVTRIAI